MLTKRQRNKNKALIALAVAFLLWGFNTPFIKISLEAVPLYVLICFKFLVGGLFLLLYKPVRWKRLSTVLWIRIFLATAIGLALSIVLTYIGIKRTGGVNVSLIYLLEPLIIFFLSIEMLKEGFKAKLLLGVIVSLMGAILVVGAPLLRGQSIHQGDFFGNVIVVTAVLTDALGNILIKPVLQKAPTRQVTTIRFLMTGIILLPLAINQLPQVGSHILSGRVLLSVAYNIIAATVIGYSLYHYGFRRVSGEQSCSFYYLGPLAGIVGSMFILHEGLTAVMLLGGLLIVSGVVMGEIKTKHYHFLRHH